MDRCKGRRVAPAFLGRRVPAGGRPGIFGSRHRSGGDRDRRLGDGCRGRPVAAVARPSGRAGAGHSGAPRRRRNRIRRRSLRASDHRNPHRKSNGAPRRLAACTIAACPHRPPGCPGPGGRRAGAETCVLGACSYRFRQHRGAGFDRNRRLRAFDLATGNRRIVRRSGHSARRCDGARRCGRPGDRSVPAGAPGAARTARGVAGGNGLN